MPRINVICKPGSRRLAEAILSHYGADGDGHEFDLETDSIPRAIEHLRRDGFAVNEPIGGHTNIFILKDADGYF